MHIINLAQASHKIDMLSPLLLFSFGDNLSSKGALYFPLQLLKAPSASPSCSFRLTNLSKTFAFNQNANLSLPFLTSLKGTVPSLICIVIIVPIPSFNNPVALFLAFSQTALLSPPPTGIL